MCPYILHYLIADTDAFLKGGKHLFLYENAFFPL